MGCKRLVALQLKVLHQFVKGIARGRARRAEPPGAFRAAPTPKTVFFDPNELACRRHYRRKTKSRVQMFCTIFLSLSLNMQHHSVHLGGPPQESAQHAVSIRHRANPAPRECGFHRVPLGASTHKRQRVGSQINGLLSSFTVSSYTSRAANCRPERGAPKAMSFGLTAEESLELGCGLCQPRRTLT